MLLKVSFGKIATISSLNNGNLLLGLQILIEYSFTIIRWKLCLLEVIQNFNGKYFRFYGINITHTLSSIQLSPVIGYKLRLLCGSKYFEGTLFHSYGIPHVFFTRTICLPSSMMTGLELWHNVRQYQCLDFMNIIQWATWFCDFSIDILSKKL